MIEIIEAILEKPYAVQYLEGLTASEDEAWCELNESKRAQIALFEEYFECMCQDPPPRLLKALEKARKSHECTWEDALEFMGFTNLDEKEIEEVLLNRFVNHG